MSARLCALSSSRVPQRKMAKPKDQRFPHNAVREATALVRLPRWAPKQKQSEAERQNTANACEISYRKTSRQLLQSEQNNVTTGCSMRLVPVRRRARIDVQRNRERNRRQGRVLHHLLDHGQGLGNLAIRHLEDQFIMHLQQHVS